MTFTEAAAQVLRLVGKPLHYKEITDVAIEKNLLSHVGKSPEVTMGARLAALVKKGDKENPLVRVKPGVFALREWDQDTIEKGLKDRTPALEKLSGHDFSSDPEGSGAAHVSLDDFTEGEPQPPDAGERERAELAAHATDLFESEDDDDRPIFGDEEEQEASADGQSKDAAAGRRRRRRRRSGGRGRAGDERGGGDELPSYTVSDAPADLPEAPVEVEARENREPVRENREPVRENREPVRENREPPREREREPVREPSRDGRDRDGREFRDREVRSERFDRDARDGRDRDRDREGRDRDREGRDRDRERDGDRNALLGDLAGRSLADSIESLLSGFDRSRGPVPLQAVVDTAQRRGRLNGEQGVGHSLIQAAVRADNARRAGEGRRPRFRLSNNKLSLCDWHADGDLARAERDLFNALERYREAARRGLLRTLQELPQRALGELVVLLLEQMGYSELGPVRRPGSHGAELHLTGKVRGALGELRSAIVVRRDGREIGRERVTELRGGLHHYGAATAGVLITTGQALSGAREEASASGAAPVAVIDGIALARLCDEHRVGVSELTLRLPLPDADLLDGLRAG
ncbi:MAG: HTH domain-containing protein [Polyangiaceae bacterium]